MKTSGTAAAAHDRARKAAPPAKPVAKHAAGSVASGATAKSTAKPTARAAVAAVATKKAPAASKAVPAKAAKPPQTTAPKPPEAVKPLQPEQATGPAKAATPAPGAKTSQPPKPAPATAKQAAAKPAPAPKATVAKAAPAERPAPEPAVSVAPVAAQAPAAPPSEKPEAATPAPAPRPAPEAARRPGPPGPHGGPLTQPRLPAKAEVFQEGDHVVYPTHGVGKVERIATEEIAGHKLELIHITFEENRMTLRVPVAKARTAGLRKLATRKLFEEALNVLKGRARIKRTMWSRRAQEYEAKINSGDPLAIAEVVRDLHRNAGQPDQSFSERQIYEAAMDRLAAELAALDKTDKVTAANKLTDFLKTV